MLIKIFSALVIMAVEGMETVHPNTIAENSSIFSLIQMH